MNTLDRNQLINQLNWRYATKQFDAHRKISAEDWKSLEEALVLTPSSCGLQPWKFVVVNDRPTREKLVGASHGQSQIADASHLVVFAIKKNFGEKDVDRHLDRIVNVRGVPRDALSGFRDMMMGAIINRFDAAGLKVWQTKQIYIALGNFLTSAAVLGIDACPMEGIDPAQYDEILGLDQRGLSTVVVATTGYRAETDKYSQAKKVRFPREEILVNI
jgi:nitroreductase